MLAFGCGFGLVLDEPVGRSTAEKMTEHNSFGEPSAVVSPEAEQVLLGCWLFVGFGMWVGAGEPSAVVSTEAEQVLLGCWLCVGFRM